MGKLNSKVLTGSQKNPAPSAKKGSKKPES